MKKLISPLSFLMVMMVATLSMSACSKKVEQPVMPVQETNLTSTYGTVWLVDQYGSYTNNYEGIEVSITGNGISMKTTTAKDGRFDFKNIPTGTYRVAYQKEGFDSTVQMATVSGYQYIKQAILGPKATHEIFIQEARIQSDKILMNMSAIPEAGAITPIGYIVFASNSPDVSSTNAQYSRPTNAGVLSDQYLDLPDLQKSGIDINATIYLALYPKTFRATQSNDNGVITFPTINLAGKKVATVVK